MLKFNDLPIRKKIILIILVGMSCAMLVSLIYFFSFDKSTAKNNLFEEMLTLSKITAQRSSAAVAFQDKRNAKGNLETLALRKSVQSACIYDTENLLFTFYNREPVSRFNCKPRLWDLTSGYKTQSLVVVEPISNKSQTLGNLVITSDLSPISSRTYIWLKISSGMFLLSFLVAFLMTQRMQRSIVEPVANLSDIMERVKKDNDLSLRAKAVGNDELGKLVTTFNEMLEIISYGNKDLKILYDDLVKKSAEAETVSIELESRNSQIKEMISSAAHDLRQPLQALGIFVDALQTQPDKNKQEIIISKIRKSMSNLNELFDEILDVSKAEQQAKENELQLININELFNKLHVEFQAMARNKHLEFRIRMNDVCLRTSPGILERIIRNLLSNAVNYTDKGGILLACHVKRGNFLIEIWDTGRGIPERKQESIFNKFERVEENGVDRKAGYGLGLAIVNQFIQMLGYSLTVKSTVGRGSCFRISIPKKYLLTEPNLPRKSTRMISKPVRINNFGKKPYRFIPEGKKHILLIDDDENVRDSVKMMLEDWDLSVDDFDGLNSMQEFYAAGKYRRPDCIISDYQLSDQVTGDQVIHVAQDTLGHDVPALIITGNRSQSVHEAIKNKGIPIILKPINAHQLKSWIEELTHH